jgi:hypothetical protein
MMHVSRDVYQSGTISGKSWFAKKNTFSLASIQKLASATREVPGEHVHTSVGEAVFVHWMCGR